MKKNLIQLLPFFIATALVVLHIIEVQIISYNSGQNGEATPYSIIDAVFYAAIGLSITLIFILFKQTYWKYLFLGLVLLSFTPLIQFYNWTFSISIGFVSIEMTAFGLLILHLGLNSEMIHNIISKLEPSEETVRKQQELKAEQIENKIKRFELKFKSKKKSELESIVNEKSFVPEAIEAAKRLLSK